MPPRSENVGDVLAWLDLIPGAAALVASDGSVLGVNAEWNAFAEANGSTWSVFDGSNYLHVCRQSQGAEYTVANRFADGLADVLDGRADDFELMYPCHASDTSRWFKAVVRRHAAGAIVTHIDISRECNAWQIHQGMIIDKAAVHDIKTPLNAVIGYAELAQLAQESSSVTVDLEDCLKTIRQSAERMLQEINTLLVNRETGPVVEETVEVGRLLATVASEHRDNARLNRSTVEVRARRPMWVRADREKLTRIVNNLCANALKYGGPSATIVLEVSRNASGGVEIAVADDGPGIPAALQDAVFDPGTRGEAGAGQAGREGAGYGLALVRTLVHGHGGEVFLQSTEGAGTRFTVALPAWRSVKDT